MKFIFQIEEKFDVEISEEDMMDESFSTIGGLVQIILNKMI